MVIKHSQAVDLEHIVRKLYKCDRCGVSGLVNSDEFESNPIEAANLVVAYIYANGLNEGDDQYASFLSKYSVMFSAAEDIIDAEQYIDELLEIVNKYCR